MAPRPCRTTPFLSLITSPGRTITAPLPPTPLSLTKVARARARAFSTSNKNAPMDPPPQRWPSDLRTRIGKCILFGCSPAQVAEAGGVLRALATEWRALVAGSEGFLTGGRRGLEGQQVVWGEMDSFVRHVVVHVRAPLEGRVASLPPSPLPPPPCPFPVRSARR